jgi:hypothetical protein
MGDGAMYSVAPGGDLENLEQWSVNKHVARAEELTVRARVVVAVPR